MLHLESHLICIKSLHYSKVFFGIHPDRLEAHVSLMFMLDDESIQTGIEKEESISNALYISIQSRMLPLRCSFFKPGLNPFPGVKARTKLHKIEIFNVVNEFIEVRKECAKTRFPGKFHGNSTVSRKFLNEPFTPFFILLVRENCCNKPPAPGRFRIDCIT